MCCRELYNHTGNDGINFAAFENTNLVYMHLVDTVYMDYCVVIYLCQNVFVSLGLFLYSIGHSFRVITFVSFHSCHWVYFSYFKGGNEKMLLFVSLRSCHWVYFSYLNSRGQGYCSNEKMAQKKHNDTNVITRKEWPKYAWYTWLSRHTSVTTASVQWLFSGQSAGHPPSAAEVIWCRVMNICIWCSVTESNISTASMYCTVRRLPFSSTVVHFALLCTAIHIQKP